MKDLCEGNEARLAGNWLSLASGDDDAMEWKILAASQAALIL